MARPEPRIAGTAAGDELAEALILSLQGLGAAVASGVVGAATPAVGGISMEDQETMRPEAHTR